MFIQCQNCKSTFKIDEHKIPQKKSVVRCTKCSELIPLNQETQNELLKKSPTKIVECNSCGTQYSIPLNSIKQEETKVRCGKCSNLFTVKRSDVDEPIDFTADEYENSIENDELDLDNIDIPSESEFEVDDLFADVSDGNEKKVKRKKTKDATEEYLESVRLTKEGDEEVEADDLGIQQISEDKKYKIFLKPSFGKKKQKEQDSHDDGVDFGIEEPISKKEKKAKISKKKSKDDEQKPKLFKNKFLWIIWLLIILVLVALAWVVMKTNTGAIYTKPQTETYDSQSKVAILEPLNGKFIDNLQIPEKMFVLEGKLLNVYGKDIALSKIEIEGYLYTTNSDQPITAISFAGVTLSESELKSQNKIEIESALMSQSQDSSGLIEFGPDDLIDFQVVFFNAPKSNNIDKLGARIKKFNRRKL